MWKVCPNLHSHQQPKGTTVELLSSMNFSSFVNLKSKKLKFPGGTGYGIITAMDLVTAVARVQSLAWQLLRDAGAAKNKTKNN